MFLAKVKKRIVSSHKHKAYQNRIIYLVREVLPDGSELDAEWVAMDYVGAGVDDIVVCGGAPGVAREVFNLKKAPIRTLIMAVVDTINY